MCLGCGAPFPQRLRTSGSFLHWLLKCYSGREIYRRFICSPQFSLSLSSLAAAAAGSGCAGFSWGLGGGGLSAPPLPAEMGGGQASGTRATLAPPGGSPAFVSGKAAAGARRSWSARVLGGISWGRGLMVPTQPIALSTGRRGFLCLSCKPL